MFARQRICPRSRSRSRWRLARPLINDQSRSIAITRCSGAEMPLRIRPKQQCRWDLISLGEVMLRLDPADRPISSARSFGVYEGGGEYNVARGLKRWYGLDTAIFSAFVDNPVGRLLHD